MENERPSSLQALLRQLDEQGITDYRRYQQVRNYLEFKARDRNHPISGSFELTPRCNLDCKMCYVHLHKEQMHGAELLTTEQWKDIMRQSIDAGMMFATLTGGECLTYPGFDELCLFLQERGVQVSVLSNGLLMNAERVAFFKAHPPAIMQVTLYGASEEAYERVTGKRAFARVMENLHRLREAELPLLVSTTPNAFMTDGEAMVQLLHENGFPFQINSGLVRPREETGRALADADLDAYVAMYRLRSELTGGTLEPECDVDTLPNPGGGQTETPKGVRCGAGRSGFSIDWRGGMKPCNNFPCTPENVLSLGVAEAWRRTNRTALNYPQPVECEDCVYQSVCKRCVAEHAAGAEPGHASLSVCAWGKRMVAEGLLKI